MIVKEQTAQAIANTARAYEKSGVEAALSEVRMTEGAPIQEGRAFSSNFHSSLTFCDSMFLLHLTSPSLFLHFFLLILSILLLQLKEAEPKNPLPPETDFAEQSEQPPEAHDADSAAPPHSEVSEVEIPSVGRILVRADADGYDEEVQSRGQG